MPFLLFCLHPFLSLFTLHLYIPPSSPLFHANSFSLFHPFPSLFQDINGIREYLRELNGKTAATTAIVIFILASNLSFGKVTTPKPVHVITILTTPQCTLNILLLNPAFLTMGDINDVEHQHGKYFNDGLATASAVLNFLLWTLPVVLPFVQVVLATYTTFSL